MPTVEINANGDTLIADVMFMAGVAASKSEARRLIDDGGVKIEVKNPVIAISNTKFKDDGEYSALLHPSYF